MKTCRLDRRRRAPYTGLDDEDVYVMNEMSSRMRANMEKVLRAMDVIPPFDNDKGSRRRAKAVPTLDLGEKILAEQRRLTARKRKAPGTAEVEKEIVREDNGAAEVGPDLVREERADAISLRGDRASDEVAELHQIVADIVARDIERLCEGLQSDACCPV
ncbi:MAG: hypothetical protein ACYTAS_22540 [Planctomycetota bacterium]|jgi:hypothetical protein